ncbi:replication factor RFC1 C terminal domain-containing protein [Fimicolochytrium jonesii]|uniref:replication factor RFC1 C terminal domain-containing protein n=1 Tax=Fimicolochytrium jonesii TaxID=1396493 RepID=UPI0022FEFE96|nr:replication factor RFC1 C terminal domain-containing protein [Fimicolochytrium jonesii]KAI8817938.1 replication factor RFC1 C terminal domain-containing protein [Fimicolochytrium jonesii]
MSRKSAGPVALGSKQIPEGAENCLAGLTFVFTGDLSSISRDTATDLVKRYGGKTTTAASSRTSYVVVGAEPGESKMKKVKEHNIKTVDEDGFFDLIRTRPAASSSPAKGSTAKGKAKTSAAATAAASKITPAAAPLDGNEQLWTTKYKPRSYSDIIGNKTLVQNLAAWLKDWEKNRKNGFKRMGGQEFSANRAALLSGPPGIGKTTTAHLVAEMEGFNVLELNASDTRNKKALDETLGTYAVTEFFLPENQADEAPKGKEQAAPVERKKQIVIMDEVDGMSGGDRGGSAELIQLIKKTKVPIICICNDRQSAKVKSLANYCADFRFRRCGRKFRCSFPVESACAHNINREGLELKPNVVTELTSSTGADIRQILNLLSTYRLGSGVMNYDQSKDLARSAEKNTTISPFEATANLLGGGSFNNMRFYEKMELYFHDYSLMPLMIQESYIKTQPAIARSLGGANPKKVALEHLLCLSNAADSISQADILDNVQRSWSLMPLHAVLSTVRPAFFTHGSIGGPTGFPSWLGQNSKQMKNTRQLREIQSHMRLHISGNKREVRLSYLPALAPALAQPLIKQGADAIEDVIQVMDDYYLNKEDWDSVMELGLGQLSMAKLANKIPTAVKSSFTRIYNKGTHPTAVVSLHVSKGKTKAAAGPAPDLEDIVEAEEPDMEEDDEAEDEDDIATDRMIKQKKAPAASSKAAAPAAAKGRGKANASSSKKK